MPLPAPDHRALVLDTNVALDLLWFRDRSVQPLAESLEAGHARLVSAPSLRAELARQLGSPRLARWARGPAHAAAALQHYDGWCLRGRWVDDPASAPTHGLRCTDPDDQVFIDLALAHGAGGLLSQDRALLRLARRARSFGLHIATPTAWLATLQAPARAGTWGGG